MADADGAETLEADLVVIGGGLAAQRAALEAGRLGASVLMLEKMEAVGGSSVMSGGSFAFAGTPQQRDAGIEDSAALMRDDLIAVGGGCNEPALVDVLVAGQLAEYELLCEAGIAFKPVQSSSGQSVPRTHSTNPREVLETLHRLVAAMPGFALRLRTAATRLRRGAGGRFDAVEAEDVATGRRLICRARRGILLATGGFSRGEDLLELFAPETRKAVRGGGPGNAGDGIRLAWEHGAALADMGYVKGTFGAWPEEIPGEAHTILLAVYRGAIAVNLAAQRFANESWSYKKLGSACLEQPQARAFQIFDETVMAQAVEGIPTFDFRAAQRKGRLVSAPTLRDLADRLGLDAGTLATTVATYNADIDRHGEDRSFGRKHLSHTFGTPTPIARGPFHAYPCSTVINSTYAGLRVRPDMTVVDIRGAPMDGLYAAGEVTGGFHGEAYMTGSSLVKALVCGRVAARAALGGNG